MKKPTIIISILFSSLLICNNLQAATDYWEIIEDMVTEEVKQFHTVKGATNKKKDFYKTWTVIGVTTDTIIMQRKKRNDEMDEVKIERSRRPYLKVGDRVRYDKVRNRLRQTLGKKQDVSD